MKGDIILTSNQKALSLENVFSIEEVGAEIIYSVLFSFKKHLLGSSEKTKKLVQPVLEEIEKYMDAQLLKIDVGYVNKKNITLFLVKHFDSVHAIVETCTFVREKFGKEIPIKLELLKDKDTSENAYIRLCLYLPEFSEQFEEDVEKITSPITEKFLKKGLLFYITPEYITKNGQ